MISISKVMDSFGVNGHLLAFFKAVCIYFAVSGGEESVAGAALKCAPVLLLLYAVLAQRAALPAHKERERRRYCLLVGCGLALSALGDALLVWAQLFVWGMAAFAGAHVAYSAALGWRPLAPQLGAPLLAGGAAYACAVRPPPGALRVLLPAYALLLAGTAWRGAAQARRRPAAALGAALFLLSDAALGYSMFVRPLPYRQALVMSTYYAAQLGLAVSALRPPRGSAGEAEGAPQPAQDLGAPSAGPSSAKISDD